MPETTALAQLRIDAEAREVLNQRLGRLCLESHEAGATWREVAEAAGMTAPGARKAALRWKESCGG